MEARTKKDIIDSINNQNSSNDITLKLDSGKQAKMTQQRSEQQLLDKSESILKNHKRVPIT